MPESATLEAPAAAPAAPSAPIAAPNPLSPSREGVMQRSLDMLKATGAQKQTEPKPPVPTKATAPKPVDSEEKKKTDKVAEPEKAEVTSPDKTSKPDEAQKVEAEKSTGPKDWKLLNQIKAERDTLKRQLAEKVKAVDDTEKKALTEQLDQHRRELETERKSKKEVEDLLRFRDYQNTKEFQDNYVKPWETGWAEAESNLKGIKLTDDSGTEREISKSDIQALSEMDIPTARDAIRKLVPDTTDAADVRRHVDNIRSLTNKHKAALEKAWTDSDKWQKDQQTKQQQERQDNERVLTTLQSENAELFKQFDTADRAKIEFLKPVDGDDEWNERLTKSEAFVKEALNGQVNNPNLSKDERSKLIQRNTAVINRSIAFGPLKLKLARAEAKLAEKEKIIAGYQSSEPTPGNGKVKSAGPAVSDNPMAAARQRMRSSQYMT